MKYSSLFPYENRSLGMSKEKTQPEDNRSSARLASITLANLKKGDHIAFPKGVVDVTAVSDDAIGYKMTVDEQKTEYSVDAADIEGSLLYQAIVALIPSLAPGYTNPICSLIERDPSVFRARDGEGWVISDALCLMSGNISYKLNSDKSCSEKTPPATTLDETLGNAQGAFDF
tara:strand:- start:3644 stop:4162 length:519 start_codon:yes stop_codon:yes gene_type:complete